MDLELAGKHVLVTGGSRGIGLACARAFARENARVTIVSRSASNVEAALAALAAQGVPCEGRTADLRDSDAAARLVQELEDQRGPVDVLVNSAGAARRTPFAELTPADWRDAMQDKFFSYIFVTDLLAKRMGARGAGAIVNIIGMGGKTPRNTHLAGGAANAALMLATAGMAAAWAPRGVRINAINPGLTLTDRLEKGLDAEARQDGISAGAVRERLTRSVPLGRLARPEEIADAALWLASERASYVTAATLNMDGAAAPFI